MTSECATYVVKTIQKNFNRHFGEEGLKLIKTDLMQESDEAMMAAGERILLSMSHLPSPSDLLRIVQEEGRKILLAEAKHREDEWKKTKGESGNGRVEGSTFLSKEQQSEYGKRSLQLVRKAMEEGTTAELLEGMLQIAKDFPHAAEYWRESHDFLSSRLNQKRTSHDR